MHRSPFLLAAVTGLAAALALAGPAEVAGQELSGPLRIRASTFTNAPALRRFDALVETLSAGGELVLAASRPDTRLAGRTQQFFQQYHEGVPVYGAGVSRQRAGRATLSLLGTIETGIEVDPAPRFLPVEALELIEQQTGAGPLTDTLPELVVLRVLPGRYVLAYQAAMRDLRTYFLDAHSGRIVYDESLLHEQDVPAIGGGLGYLDVPQKLSVAQAGGRFEARDLLRPAPIITLDMRFDFDRVFDIFEHIVPVGRNDIASDDDNFWEDWAVIGGHVHSGFTYDYYRSRHGWNGIDGEDSPMYTLVNIMEGFDNAVYALPPAGPGQRGATAFGESGLGPNTGIDVVAHEWQHGVTHFGVFRRTDSKLVKNNEYILGPESFTLTDELDFLLQPGEHRCGQSYTWDYAEVPEFEGRKFEFLCEDGRFVLMANEAGAINEAWSDMFGTAVEFMVEDLSPGPLRADYQIGEDPPPVVRSMSDPASLLLEGESFSAPIFRYPDAASRMIRFLVFEVEYDERFFYSIYGSVDGRDIRLIDALFYDGIHWNSTVFSHAFYLAIEGGRNRTTGRLVQGVGGDRRHAIEQVFFRAMHQLMPARTNMSTAAAAVRMAAQDLFGPRGRNPDSAVVNAVEQALTAVDLP